MPPEWFDYVRLRAAALRRRTCRELFGWSDEEYDAAPARFCDWAMAFSRAEAEGHRKRTEREIERRGREAGRG